MSVALLLLLLTLDAAPPAPTPAPTELTVAQRIKRGRAALDALEFDAGALDLTLAANDERATRTEKIEANLYAGIAHRVLGRDTDARLHFIWVLKNAPDTPLPPDAGPKITSFYELVRNEVTTAPAPAAAPTAPTPPPQQQLTISWVALAGAGAVAAGVVVAAVGAFPWFEHAKTRALLRAAAVEGADGTELQQQQAQQRADWESWGQLAVAGGAVVAVAGVGTLAYAAVAEAP